MSDTHATELKTHLPPAGLVAAARVSGMAAYQALVDEAERDYEGFWARLALSLIHICPWRPPPPSPACP